MKLKIFSMFTLLFLLICCGNENEVKESDGDNKTTEKESQTTDSDATENEDKDENGSVENSTKYPEITKVPEYLGTQFTNNFDRHVEYIAQNGGKIHIVAQNNIRKGQIIRAWNVLSHYLTDYEGSDYGADKTGVANKMAENRAILCLLNGRDGESEGLELPCQSLFEKEIQVEGGDWYINQNYEYRDATFEEILHMVHDYGIGVDGPNSSPGALPEFQKQIRAAQVNSLEKKIWGTSSPDWIEELRQENSLSQEYLAAVIDSYYGLWGAWEENPTHGMWGEYVAKTRGEIETEDPMGNELMNRKYFHPHLTYNARIEESFRGIFSLKFDEKLKYTNHSRYLRDVTLTGKNDSGIRVNELDNFITGNEGINTVVFSGNSSEYEIKKAGDETVITDKKESRDGKNRLRNIEKLEFQDKSVEL